MELILREPDQSLRDWVAQYTARGADATVPTTNLRFIQPVLDIGRILAGSADEVALRPGTVGTVQGKPLYAVINGTVEASISGRGTSAASPLFVQTQQAAPEVAGWRSIHWDTRAATVSSQRFIEVSQPSFPGIIAGYFVIPAKWTFFRTTDANLTVQPKAAMSIYGGLDSSSLPEAPIAGVVPGTVGLYLSASGTGNWSKAPTAQWIAFPMNVIRPDLPAQDVDLVFKAEGESSGNAQQGRWAVILGLSRAALAEFDRNHPPEKPEKPTKKK